MGIFANDLVVDTKVILMGQKEERHRKDSEAHAMFIVVTHKRIHAAQNDSCLKIAEDKTICLVALVSPIDFKMM